MLTSGKIFFKNFATRICILKLFYLKYFYEKIIFTNINVYLFKSFNTSL